MVSEAGTKAVKVDGLFSWMAKLRCNCTLKHIITKEIVSRELIAVKYCTSSKRTQGSGQGTEHLALCKSQVNPSRQSFVTYALHSETSVARVGNSNIYRTLLWTSQFHQGFQCKENSSQPQKQLSSAICICCSLPLHHLFEVGVMEKELGSHKPRMLCHTSLF